MLMFDGNLVNNNNSSRPPLATCSFRTFTDIDDDSLVQCGGSAIHSLIPICWFHGKINGLANSRRCSGGLRADADADADASQVYVQAYRGCCIGNRDDDDDVSLRISSPAFVADVTIFSYFGAHDTVMAIFERICNDMVLVGPVGTVTTKNATIEFRRVGGSVVDVDGGSVSGCGIESDGDRSSDAWVLDVKAMRDISSGETINVDVDYVRSRSDGGTTVSSASASETSASSLSLQMSRSLYILTR